MKLFIINPFYIVMVSLFICRISYDRFRLKRKINYWNEKNG